MYRYQRGVTFLGWLFILLPMALVLYAGIRLAPVYLEYMKIARTLDRVATEFKGEQTDPRQLRTSIDRHFEIEDVHVMTARSEDKLKVTKDGTGYILEASYADTAPYMGNISLVVAFDKVVHTE
jgi:hypothetical protein